MVFLWTTKFTSDVNFASADLISVNIPDLNLAASIKPYEYWVNFFFLKFVDQCYKCFPLCLLLKLRIRVTNKYEQKESKRVRKTVITRFIQATKTGEKCARERVRMFGVANEYRKL